MSRWLSRLADRVTLATGSPWASMLALLIIAAWAVSGPLFHYSAAWQLIINTGTTIVTFVMVFFIQHSTNRSDRATHVKLDEILVHLDATRSELAGLEDADDAEIRRVQSELRNESAP